MLRFSSQEVGSVGALDRNGVVGERSGFEGG